MRRSLELPDQGSRPQVDMAEPAVSVFGERKGTADALDAIPVDSQPDPVGDLIRAAHAPDESHVVVVRPIDRRPSAGAGRRALAELPPREKRSVFADGGESLGERIHSDERGGESGQ